MQGYDRFRAKCEEWPDCYDKIRVSLYIKEKRAQVFESSSSFVLISKGLHERLALLADFETVSTGARHHPGDFFFRLP